MKKLLGMIGMLLTVAGASAMAQETSGYVQVAYGHILQKDGTWKNIAGTWLPYTAHPIKTRRLQAISLPGFETGPTRPSNRPQPRLLTNVYQADAGSGYGVLGDTGGMDINPDTLDDMLIDAAGVGKTWKNLTFGFQPDSNHAFLMRWIIYETYVPGGGLNSFSHVPSPASDFGVIWPGSDPGTAYDVTINVAAAAPFCDQAQIYVAEEFRDLSDLVTGNGPLDPGIHVVYNAGGPVTRGSSNNGFWWDWDPMDGIFDDTAEFDVFDTNDPPASYGNLLFGISVDTSYVTNYIQPFPVNLDSGNLVSGTFQDVWQIDQSYYITSQATNVSRGAPTIQVEMDGLATSTTAVSMHFSLTAAGNQGGYPVKIYFFNFTTSTWDLRSTFTLSNIDTLYDAASTNNPAQYIGQAAPNLKKMKVRVCLFPSTNGARGFQFKIDQGQWAVTH